MAKRGSVTQAVTDVILCSKTKLAPEGFLLAGEINGVTVCFKSGPIAHRPPPSIPGDHQSAINELENNLYYMNIRNGSNGTNMNDNGKTANNNDYELIRTSYRLDPNPPPRPAPRPPPHLAPHSTGNIRIEHYKAEVNSIFTNEIFPTSDSSFNKYPTGTLGTHTEMDGVPFVLNSALSRNPAADFDVSFDTQLGLPFKSIQILNIN